MCVPQFTYSHACAGLKYHAPHEDNLNPLLRPVVDRTKDLEDWADAYRNFLERKIHVFAFANNQHSGYAPNTLKLFEELIEKK